MYRRKDEQTEKERKAAVWQKINLSFTKKMFQAKGVNLKTALKTKSDILCFKKFSVQSKEKLH